MNRPLALEGAAAINDYLAKRYETTKPYRLELTNVTPTIRVLSIEPQLLYEGFGRRRRNRAPILTGQFPLRALITTDYGDRGVYFTGVVESGRNMYGLNMNSINGGWDLLVNLYREHTEVDLVPVF